MRGATEQRELDFHIDNTPMCYAQKQSVFKNLARKKKRGVYDPRKAPQAFKYVVDRCAKDYAREFATPREWNRIFSPADRRDLSRDLVREFESEYRVGALGAIPRSPGIWAAVGVGASAVVALGIWALGRRPS